MQTFLPVADFEESARLLDSPRLGKQRVETLQVLRALELPDYGWTSHPVVRMWRGRTPALVAYGLATVRVWRERGFADTTHTLIAEFAPDVVGVPQEELARAGMLPSWVGDETVHLSHRSNLLAKEPDFYRPLFQPLFGAEPEDLPYVWPEPDDLPPAPPPEGAQVWVVRPRAHNELGACLAAGVVGLGTQSGIDVDATGLSPVELRALSKEISGRRPANDRDRHAHDAPPRRARVPACLFRFSPRTFRSPAFSWAVSSAPPIAVATAPAWTPWRARPTTASPRWTMKPWPRTASRRCATASAGT